jgi:NAD(P)-dependent dehydrogenase (short-subunit alcohol dehydrogenase family)
MNQSIQLPKTPSFNLFGKTALVTGAGRGIGQASAAALAQAGAAVTLVARTKNEIEETARAISEDGGHAKVLTLDVTDLEEVASAIATSEAFDILVNNAGTNVPASFLDVQIADFDKVMNLNVRSSFFMAQAVARKLVKIKKPGSIINVSSQMGHVGGPKRTVYCTSKHAVEGMTKAMSLDLAPHGIRVNTLCPTFIETPMTRPFLTDDSFRQSVLNKIKLGRLGQVEDLMGAIVFLASDASSLMTGTSLVIDGGWTAE